MVNVKCKISIDTTMKKTYIIPTTKTTMVSLHGRVMDTISINSKAIDSSNAGLVRQDKGWDLWGDDNDFDN